MSDAQVTVLMPTRNVWAGIELTIESIRKKTNPNTTVEILVCDNSLAPNARACEPARTVAPGEDDGNRREYLRGLADKGDIFLIENIDQSRKYGHGENIRVMLERVTTPYAMLFNSTSEILRADWLDVLTAMIRDPEHDLGVARFRAGGARECDYITPTYWPNMMLVNVPLLRRVFPENRWDLEQIGFEDFHRPEIFTDYPKNPDRKPPLVFADTAWRLWEKLTYDNPYGARMLPLPEPAYWNHWIKWLGGIDRNSFRPDHPHVVSTLAEIDQRLAALRREP
jgi:hypothetical protein